MELFGRRDSGVVEGEPVATAPATAWLTASRA
jgi:hypothetical protein